MTKLDRQSYDLIKDAFDYYEFKMTTDQRDLAETILHIAFTVTDKPVNTLTYNY